MKPKIYTLVIPRFEDIFHSYFAQEIIKGASSAASRLKVDILVHITERNQHDDWFTAEALSSRITDGIVFADIDQDQASLTKIIEKNIPYMVLNNSFMGPINYVSIDNYKSTRRVMDYLIKLGHTKIATICGDLSTEAGEERLKGYNDGLKASGIEVNKGYIKKGEFLRTPARRAAEQLLSLQDKPTAIFAASDVMALEVIDVAKNLKLKVPETLSVVGFDDNPLNNYCSVSLTTVKQPLDEMARLGIESLHRIVCGWDKPPLQKILSARLIKRNSCAGYKRAIKIKK